MSKMVDELHYSTFEAFRPHFDALARVGYFKSIKKNLRRSKYNMHRAYMGIILLLILLYNLQHVIQVIRVRHSPDRIINTMLVLLSTMNALGKHLAFNLRSSRIDRLISVIDDPSRREALVSAIEDNGKDWPSVSKETNVSVEVCQMSFDELKKDVKKTEIDNKKKIMGTGGGPPGPSDDDPLNRIKKIIEPQIEGLYTIYDADSNLMNQYQNSLPETERIHPIERDFIYKTDIVPELVAEVNTEELKMNIYDADNWTLFACTNAYHDGVMSANAVSMSRLLTFYHAAIFTCGFLWGTFPYVNRFYGKIDFTAYFPFHIESSPAFELAIAYLTILITVQAYGHVTMDCTIVSFYAQGKTQLQMLRYNLEHLADTDDEIKIKLDIHRENKKRFQFKDVASRTFKQKVHRRFVHCVQHYRQIVWFIEEVESLFGEAMVLQFAVIAWVICMTLYKIAGLSLKSVEFVSMAVYLGCMLSQLFIYCYYGTWLKIESQLVNQSVYCLEWLQLSPSFRKQLLVLMERCFQPIMPRTAYVVPMSLETYIAVLRLSYTLFTVLDRK